MLCAVIQQKLRPAALQARVCICKELLRLRCRLLHEGIGLPFCRSERPFGNGQRVLRAAHILVRRGLRGLKDAVEPERSLRDGASLSDLKLPAFQLRGELPVLRSQIFILRLQLKENVDERG